MDMITALGAYVAIYSYDVDMLYNSYCIVHPYLYIASINELSLTVSILHEIFEDDSIMIIYVNINPTVTILSCSNSYPNALTHCDINKAI